MIFKKKKEKLIYYNACSFEEFQTIFKKIRGIIILYLYEIVKNFIEFPKKRIIFIENIKRKY